MSHRSVVPVVDEMTRFFIIESLRQTGEELDRLSHRASEAGGDDAIRLADAAQDVHRALIALGPA